MKRLIAAVVAVSALSSLTACNNSNNATLVTDEQVSAAAASSANGLLKEQRNNRLEAEPGEILVALKPGTGSRIKSLADKINAKFKTTTEDTIPSLDTLLLKADSKANTDEIIKQLNNSRDMDVQVAGPNYKVWMMLDSNDPMSRDQYTLDITQTKKAWDITQGNEGTIIAIVDTGIDLTHPDLKDKLLPGFSALKKDEGDMKVGGDDNGHGTHCAGIAAGIGNNGVGIAGIALKNKIQPVRVLGGAGSGSLFSIAKGVDWAGSNGAKVISMSLGGPSSQMDLVVDRAVQKALKAGASVVAAMGNSGKEEKSVPACLKGVIAVGATDNKDKKAPFSTFGSHITVGAPGVAILSTMPTYDVFLTKEYGLSKNYAALNGTSMATPAVSGVVGLLRSKFPNLTPEQVKEKISKSVDDLGDPGFDKLYGHGRINAFKAVSGSR